MTRTLNTLTNLFPLWIVISGILALMDKGGSEWFGWFLDYKLSVPGLEEPLSLTAPGLALIMLGMGITLTLEDFRRVKNAPRPIAVGFAAQYLIMPLLGWGIANLLNLSNEFAAGLILVACCPGGTASNLVAYLARANLALSVSMTMCATLAAIAMTPLLTKLYASQFVAVNLWKLFLDTAIVIVPVLIGLGLKQLFPRVVSRVQSAGPFVAVVVIVLIVAAIMEKKAVTIRAEGHILLLAVVLLHTAAFGFGYLFARLFRYDQVTSRTVSIEVGMQNSGLGAHLATSNKAVFGANAATSCAISAIMHCIIGSILAALWRRDAERMGNNDPDPILSEIPNEKDES